MRVLHAHVCLFVRTGSVALVPFPGQARCPDLVYARFLNGRNGPSTPGNHQMKLEIGNCPRCRMTLPLGRHVQWDGPLHSGWIARVGKDVPTK